METQAIFNTVFTKLVDAAQPIPGFRRVKGGLFLKLLGTTFFFRYVDVCMHLTPAIIYGHTCIPHVIFV